MVLGAIPIGLVGCKDRPNVVERLLQSKQRWIVIIHGKLRGH